MSVFSNRPVDHPVVRPFLPLVLALSLLIAAMSLLLPQDAYAALPPAPIPAAAVRSTDRLTSSTVQTTTVQPQSDIIIINVPPHAQDASLTTDEDTPLLGTLIATDGNEGDVLTYEIITAPTRGSAEITDLHSGDFRYTPEQDFYGTDIFTFRVTDAGGLSDTGVVELVVEPINDAPVFQSTPPLTSTAGITYTAHVTATDAEQQDVTIQAPVKPAWLTLQDHGDGTASLQGMPTLADLGEHRLELQARDSSGKQQTEVLWLRVEPPDEANLDLRLTSSADLVGLGDPLSYTLVLTNYGPVAARDLVVTVDFTDGMTLATGQGAIDAGDDWVCSFNDQMLQCICFSSHLHTAATSAITIGTRVTAQRGRLVARAQATAENSPPGLAATDEIMVRLMERVYLPVIRRINY